MDSDAQHRPARLDGGFGLVEIIVAMVIIALLLSIGIYAVASARTSGRQLAAIASAHAYANAADAFARDHDGRYPGTTNGRDWQAGRVERGPKADILGDVRFYLRAVPEAVQSRQVAMGRAGPARIDYRPVGTGPNFTGYRFTIDVQGRPRCVVLGGTATAGTDVECSRR